MSIQVLIEALREFLVIIPSILLAITFREYIVGYIAYKLGDTTPVDTGLLSFNPFNFIDNIGLIFFIAFGYGWGKQIAVDFRNLKKRSYYLYFELIGIFSNFVLALFFMLLIILYRPSPVGYIYNLFMNIIKINLNYFIVSFLPLLPLPGGRVVAFFWEDYNRTEFFCLILLFLFFILGGGNVFDVAVVNFMKIIE